MIGEREAIGKLRSVIMLVSFHDESYPIFHRIIIQINK